MPAFVGIADDRDFRFLVEMDDIERAVIVARSTSLASFQI